MLKAEPNNLSFLEKARAAIPFLARTPTPLVEDRELALHGCIILGPAAEPLFPTLRDLLIRDPSWNAARALAAGGPVASPHLAEALAHANADVRLYALYALVDPDSDSEQDLDALAPPLLRLLRTSKGNEAGQASAALQRMDADPKLVISLMIERLPTADAFARGCFFETLQFYGAEAEAAVPILLKFREHPDPCIPWLADRALRGIAPEMMKDYEVIPPP